MTARLYDAAFAIVMMLLVWSFYRAQRDPANNFNLFDLIMENGRVSRIGFAFLVALLVTSWVLIRMAQNEQRSLDVVFAAYLTAWVAPIVAKLFSPPQVTTSSSSSSTTSTSTPVPLDSPAKANNAIATILDKTSKTEEKHDDHG